jgi:hypothetical protein
MRYILGNNIVCIFLTISDSEFTWTAAFVRVKACLLSENEVYARTQNIIYCHGGRQGVHQTSPLSLEFFGEKILGIKVDKNINKINEKYFK